MQDSTQQADDKVIEAARALIARMDALGATRAAGVLQQSDEAARLREALGVEQPHFCRSECCAPRREPA